MTVAPGSAEDLARGQTLLAHQTRVLEMIVRGEPLPAVLREICHVIEAMAADAVAASIHLVDGDRLVHGAAPRLSDAYNAAIDGIAIDPDIGTCSAAAARREVVVSEDLASDPRWAAYVHWPLGLGLRAAWSMPILDPDGDVIAVIGTYFAASRRPSEEEYALVETLSRTAGLAITRSRADEVLRRSDARNAFVADLEDALKLLVDAHDIIDTAAGRLSAFLDADRCTYATFEPEGDFLIRGNHARRLDPLEGRWPLGAFGHAFEAAMREGRSYVVHDSASDLQVDAAIRDAFAQTRVLAAICVPLLKHGAMTAVMSVHQAAPRRWTRDDVEVCEQVVSRCWEAIERARVGSELRESEARYRAMVDANPQCVQLIAADGTILQVNPAGQKLIETDDPGAVIGQSVHGLIAPAFRDAYRSLHERVCSGETVSLDFEMVGQTGTRRWVSTTAVPLRDAAGDIVHLAVTRDITDAKRAEQALADSRARLDYAVRLSGIGFWYCDLPFDELVWDARVKAHFQLPPEARVTIDTFYDCIHPDDREPTRAAIDTSIANHSPYDVYYRTVHRETGAVRWVRALGGTSYSEDGQPIRFDGVTVDVTDAKRDEDRLAALLDREREQARLHSEVAQAARTIYASTSIDSVLRVITEEARRIIGAHQCVTSLTTGSDWSQAIVSVSLSEKYARYRDYEAVPNGQGIYAMVCETNVPVRMTQAQLEAHPRWRGLSGHGAAHPPMRGWLAIPLTGHDGRNMGLVQLSDRIEGEFSEVDEAILVQLAQIGAVALENTRLYDQLREQDRRKDEFIATLAHELRNPLAPIRTGLGVLVRASDDATRERAVSMMDRQLSGLVRLVDDLLDVSRITLGKVTLAPEACDVREVFDSAVETARPLIDRLHHTLDVEMPGDALMVDADPARLAQILSNLLNNAAKYTPDGGRISVALAREGDQVVITVADTGVGIPPDLLDQVFDLFTQVESPGVVPQPGLGIGLTLVRRLVELHRGTVTADSAGPGCGSRFTVRLPALAAAVTAPGSSTSPARPTRALRVLVVDDNQDAAEMLRLLLEMEGHRVHVAGDGPSALEASATFAPEIVFLDIGLPGLNGYEVAARMRATLAQVPRLVALTGWGTEEDRRQAREVGFHDHLVKPVDLTRLLALLADVEPAA